MKNTEGMKNSKQGHQKRDNTRHEFILPNYHKYINQSVCNSAITWDLLRQNNHKDPDLSCKTDLDIGDCLEEKACLITQEIW